MRNNLRTNTRPINVPRSTRTHSTRAFTSMPAGKVVPIAAIGILREDAVQTSQLRFSFEMNETEEVLMNAINVKVCAHFVPWLAFDRFIGMEDFNSSYKGVPHGSAASVVPFIEQHPMPVHTSSPFYKYLGLKAPTGTLVSTMYLEAYNEIWNHRAKNASPDLVLRDRLEQSLAPAFWMHSNYKHIVPDFDQAKIHGEVPLQVANAQIPVVSSKSQYDDREGTGTSSGFPTANLPGGGSPRASDGWIVWNEIVAELQDQNITISLSTIDLAKKTAAFAQLRAQYSGIEDDHILDMLMDGMSIPEQMYKQPMLVGQQSTIFGMNKRYATDGGNLAESAVNGATTIDMNVRLPRMLTGGVLMYTAEITPELLFESEADPFLHIASPNEFPSYQRDELDTEKVDIVRNDYIDVFHSEPDGTFGYAPLNHKWNRNSPNIGGRFYRETVDTELDQDRMRMWSVESIDPKLGEDFYLVNNIHTRPFQDQINDPFECVAVGTTLITGNTVFGDRLLEASDDYEKTYEEADTTRIDKPDEVAG